MLERMLWSGVFTGMLFVTLSADVWDVQTANDNTLNTENELIHGTVQVHDLGALPGGASDEDWYRILQRRESSYEIVVDSISGDVSPITLQRIGSNGTTVLQTAPSATIVARSLRWVNAINTLVTDEFIKVSSASCGSSCGADDVYHIRAYDTTIAVARFNNSGSQITVVLVQNPTEAPINATMFFYNNAGALLATNPTVVPAKGLAVVPTSAIGALVGQGGSITIAHDGAYGSLNVKAVALEPSTGFSFDTAGVYRAK
jgi:hypothetical protein